MAIGSRISRGLPIRCLDMFTMNEIKHQIEKIAGQIHAPGTLMPTYGYSKNDGTPHVEVDDLFYYYMNLERDKKILNRKTSELDALLYWVFVDITSSMASYYEKTHRDPKIDPRRVRFEHQLFLLEIINHDWKERREIEIEEILKISPYKK